MKSSNMCCVRYERMKSRVCCRHRTEHIDRMFNASNCDPAVHKRCSFLQLTTTYCGMWAGLRNEVRRQGCPCVPCR